jgi:hypothetical protein
MVQEPVRIPDFDEPEPDLALARGTRKEYRSRHPGARGSCIDRRGTDTSLAVDRGIKRSAYARGRVPNYWFVNLVEGMVEAYSEPDESGAYRVRRDYRPGGTLTLSIDGREIGPIAVNDILP